MLIFKFMGKQRFSRFLPALLLFLAPVALFFPAFCGKFFTYGDASSYFLHLAELYRSAWFDGAIFWSDNIMSGYPTFGNPQVGLFYFANIPMLVLDPFEAVRYQIIAHGYLMVVGAYVLLRRFGHDAWMSLAVSVLFMSSGTMISLVTMTNNWMAVAWIPWIVLSCTFLDSQKGKIGFFLSLHSFLGAGEPQLAFLAYPILLISLVIHLGWRKATTPIVLMILAGTSQPWLLSFLESISRSSRQMGLVTMQNLPWVMDRTIALSLWAPSSILISDNYNGWMELNGGNMRPNWILSVYIGGVILFWASIGIIKNKLPLVWFLLVAAVGLGILSLGSIPGLDVPLSSLPIFSLIRYPIRYWILVHVILFGFAAIGLSTSRESSPRFVGISLGVISLQCAFMSAFFLYHPYQERQSSISLPLWRTIIESQLWLEVILLGLALLAILFHSRGKALTTAVVVLAAGVALHHGRGQIEFSPKSRFDLASEYKRLGLAGGFWFVNDGNAPSKDSTKAKHAKAWLDTTIKAWPDKLDSTTSRDLFSSSAMHHNGLRAYGVVLELFPRVVQGYYGFVYSSNGDQLTNLLWLLGIDRMVASVSAGPNFIHVPGRATLERLIRGPYDLAVIWKLPPGLGIVSILDTVVSDSNYNRLAFWNIQDSGSLGVTEGIDCPTGPNHVDDKDPDWTRKGPDRWKVQTKGLSGMLLLRQASYPGWKVIADGKAQDPVSVNLLYSGFCLDGTIEQVEFRFRPRYLLHSILLTALSLGILLTMLVRTRKIGD